MIIFKSLGYALNQNSSIDDTKVISSIGHGIAILTREISRSAHFRFNQITHEIQNLMLKKSKSAFLEALFEIVEVLLQLALVIHRQIKLILANALEVVYSGKFQAIQNSKLFKTGRPLELHFS